MEPPCRPAPVILKWLRCLLISLVFLAACGPPAPPGAAADPTRESWYAQSTRELAGLDRQAEAEFAAGKSDDAAALIEKGQPIEKKLVSVNHPTLEAVEAASDLDDLYGRMLLKNRHYGWARLMFQKNLSRWRHWSPQTEESKKRYQRAAAEIEQCDQEMTR